jgi:hypothetical protein
MAKVDDAHSCFRIRTRAGEGFGSKQVACANAYFPGIAGATVDLAGPDVKSALRHPAACSQQFR